jgi:hypothetical protein
VLRSQKQRRRGTSLEAAVASITGANNCQSAHHLLWLHPTTTNIQNVYNCGFTSSLSKGWMPCYKTSFHGAAFI